MVDAGEGVAVAAAAVVTVVVAVRAPVTDDAVGAAPAPPVLVGSPSSALDRVSSAWASAACLVWSVRSRLAVSTVASVWPVTT